MPIFKFQDPDGKVHEIEGPEGATSEEAFEQLQQQLQLKDTFAQTKGKVYAQDVKPRYEPGSVQEMINTPVDRLPGQAADIIPDHPFANRVAQNLFGPVPNLAAAAERKIEGNIRGIRQNLEEYVLRRPEKVRELEQEEADARVWDEALNRTRAAPYGAAIGTGLTMAAPMGWANKVGQLKNAGPLVQAALQGGTAAATTGLTTPVAPGESRKTPMAISGMIGAAGPLIKPIATTIGGALPWIGHGISRQVNRAGKYVNEKAVQAIKDEGGKRIGQITESLQYTPQQLAAAIGRVDKRLPPEVQQRLRALFNLAKPRPGFTPKPIPGREVQELRKEAGKVSRGVERSLSATPRDIQAQVAYENLIGRLDEATALTAGPKLQKALEAARKQVATGVRPMSFQEALRQGISPAVWQAVFAPRPKKPPQKRRKEI